MDRLQLREESVTGEPPFALGAQLPGDLVVERLIDDGGRIVVYEGKRLADGAKIAIKTLKMRLEEGRRDSLLLAIRGSMAISGSHVLRVLHCGLGPEGRLFWATELAERGSMRELISDGTFGPRDVVKVMAQTCAALEEAHFLGQPHGDVRLEKILLGAKAGGRPTIKVSDVGFAAELAHLVGARIRPTIPPERLRGALDRRSDVYAIGACAYEIVAARPLFFAPNEDALLRKIEREEPSPLSLLAPATPDPLARIVHKAISKNPLERFDSCRDFERALRASIGAAEGPSAIWDGPKPVVRKEDLPRIPRKTAPLWILGVGVVAGIVAMAVAVRSIGQKEGTPPPVLPVSVTPTYIPVVPPSVNSASGVVRSILKPEAPPKRGPAQL